jgi:hypothetical protein
MGLTGGAGAMFATMGALGRHPSYGFHGERGVMIGHYNYNYNYNPFSRRSTGPL